MSQFFCTVELPEELWLYILGFIDDARTLLAVGSTDRRLNRLVEDDLVWQDLFERLLYRRTRREEELGTPYRILFQKQYRLGTAPLCLQFFFCLSCSLQTVPGIAP